MIPTLIVFGLIFGRWWKATLATGVVGWAVVLLDADIITWSGVPGAAIFALFNTAVGVLIHQAVLWIVRAVRSDDRHPKVV